MLLADVSNTICGYADYYKSLSAITSILTKAKDLCGKYLTNVNVQNTERFGTRFDQDGIESLLYSEVVRK